MAHDMAMRQIEKQQYDNKLKYNKDKNQAKRKSHTHRKVRPTLTRPDSFEYCEDLHFIQKISVIVTMHDSVAQIVTV